MKTTIIYALVDPRTQQIKYIGKTNDIIKRYSAHLVESRMTKKCNWIKSLKAKNLKPILEIIDEVPANTKEEWSFWEAYYISLYKSWGFDLLNHTLGGEGGGMLGKHHSDTAKEKIGKANKAIRKGTTLSEITKLKISLKHKGHFVSEDTRQKISKAQIGKKCPWSKPPERTKERIERANVTKQKNQETGWQNPIKKRILQIDKITFEVIKDWPSATDVQKELGFGQADLSACALGRQKTAHGYMWKYI